MDEQYHGTTTVSFLEQCNSALGVAICHLQPAACKWLIEECGHHDLSAAGVQLAQEALAHSRRRCVGVTRARAAAGVSTWRRRREEWQASAVGVS